jgi:hypothetical protein
VLGWRAWRVDWLGRVPTLFSVAGRGSVEDQLWPPRRWMVAKCPNGHVETIPDESCTCGLYAAKDLDQLISLGYGYWHQMDAAIVLGEVAYAGKVIEGSQGWRAARGRLNRLWVPAHKYEWAAPIERHYRIPVGLADWRTIGLPTLQEV